MAPGGVGERSNLARRLSVALATPIALLLTLGIILGTQLVRMANDAAWVEHTDQVMATTSDTLRQIVDQEAAVRAFLLVRDRSVLEPYEHAHPVEGFRHLHDLVADNLPQQARLDEARARYERWADNAAALIAHPETATGHEGAVVRDRKASMDAIRDLMSAGYEEEAGLRRNRVATSAASAETSKILFVVLLSAAAFVLAFTSRRQLRGIATIFGEALQAETKSRKALEAESWVRVGQAKLGVALQGDPTLDQLGAACLGVLAPYTNADVGALFTNEGGTWRRHGAFALEARVAGDGFKDGEGLIGRAAREPKPIHLRDVPPGFLQVRSGTGEATPAEVFLVPAAVDGVTKAVVELGFLRPPGPNVFELLGRVGENIGLAVRSTEYKERLRELLEESQRQGEELQTQQEELRVANEELQEQSNAMRDAQHLLQERQHELEMSNTRLEEQANELLTSKQEIAANAAELARASRYKSEFVANMSHELRTPLNSTLILAKLLAENKEGNLTAEQVKYGEMIYAAGNDLLGLIGDILDFSKVEAGKLDLHVGPLQIARLRESLARTFEPVARDKGITLDFTLDPGLPAAIETDGQRLEQVLKNLLSNAIKFTERGWSRSRSSAPGRISRSA